MIKHIMAPFAPSVRARARAGSQPPLEAAYHDEDQGAGDPPRRGAMDSAATALEHGQQSSSGTMPRSSRGTPSIASGSVKLDLHVRFPVFVTLSDDWGI